MKDIYYCALTNYKKKDLSDGILERANKQDIDYERDFENWLENSPHILLDNEDDLNIIWIGRQVTAVYEDRYKYPDLLGVDAEGNVVIVELKKGKTPREVVAQILEYASWAEKLTYQQLNNITMKYFEKKNDYLGMELSEIHQKIFFPDVDEKPTITFNGRLRLFIVAEEISNTVKEIIYYLNKHGIDICCLKYDVFSNQSGEFYISTEIEEAKSVAIKSQKTSTSNVGRWNGDEPVKSVVKKAVDSVIAKRGDGLFVMREVIDVIMQEYPEFNKNTIRCQLYMDCVNHNSRKHYKGGQMDYYYQVQGTTFRLYDKSKDDIWNSDGEKIG
jgi:hypothetical protein